MNLQQIQYIVALEQHRHFGKAAEACYVTQPTLTMQLRKLEEEVGFQIFDRNKRPIEPTPSGRLVIERAQRIWQELEQLKRLVHRERELIEGVYHLGIIPTLAPYLLPLFLSTWQRQYPQARLMIREMVTSEIITALQQGKLDIGIAATPLKEDSLREIPVFYEPFLVYLPPYSRWMNVQVLHIRQLSAEQLLLLEEGHCFREQALQLCKQLESDERIFHIEAGSVETLKNLVKAGLGYTLVPYLSVHKQLSSEPVRFIQPPEPAREISLIVHRSFVKEQLLANLYEVIKASVPEKLTTSQNYRKITW